MGVTGTVKVWDPRQKDSPVANMEPMEGETKRDCWTVAFGAYLHPKLQHNHGLIKKSPLQLYR